MTPEAQISTVSVKKMYINENAQFMETVTMSPTRSAKMINVVLDNLNLTILSVMDVTAPVKVKKTLRKSKAAC